MAGKAPYETKRYKGNQNAVSHGVHVGGGMSLPKGCRQVQAELDRFVEQVRAATLAAHGEIRVYEAALIDTAASHQRRILLLFRWLRMEFDTLNFDQKTSCLREVSNASNARDKTLKDLGLDRREAPDLWGDIGKADAARASLPAPANPTADSQSSASPEIIVSDPSAEHPAD